MFQLIDEYVRESPDLSPVERAWQRSMQCAVDRALGMLSSAHTLAQHCPPLKCRVRLANFNANSFLHFVSLVHLHYGALFPLVVQA